MATATAMADGDATETAAAMVNCNRNGNGRRRQRWATATTTVTELATTTEMVIAIAMATAMARVMMTKAGLPLNVPAMCSAMAGATPCLHPHGHKGKYIHQCCVMGVTLLRVFLPFQGGGFLTAHHGLFFCLLFTTTVQFLLNNPLFAPRIIQALKNLVSPLMLYLLHSSKNPVSLLMIYTSSYCTFCQGKPGQGLQ
jgi:hypothetical protein